MTSFLESLGIRCKLVDTKRITSTWNKSLDGLEGTIVYAEKSAWEGYHVEVRVDNPPDWIKGKSNNDIVRCVYVAETKGRDIIAEVSEKGMSTLIKYCKGTLVSKEYAMKVAKGVFENTKNAGNFPEDDWMGVAGDNWDLNLWTDENGNPRATMYPVIDGNTDTSVWVEIA